jgi:hypothetical protein
LASERIRFTVIVNGVETHVVTDADSTLRSVATRALEGTQNTGRPLSDWELKDAKGIPLDLDRAIREFHFPVAIILYLTLAVGVNGTACAGATSCDVSRA